MSRIDRQRLDGTTFPLMTEVATRYSDLDMQGHVNNAAATLILQEGRVQLNEATGLPIWMGAGYRALVAASSIEYAGEIYHPAPVEVYSGYLSIGRSSITIGQVARQNGRNVLYSNFVIVMANNDGPIPLPDDMRAAYERFLLP